MAEEVAREHLIRAITFEHLLEIRHITSWREVGIHLKHISSIDIRDIDRDGFDEADKRRRLLNLWEERNGQDATYNSMIKAMLSAGKRAEADKVSNLLEKSTASPNPGGPLGPQGTTLADRPGLAILVTCDYNTNKEMMSLTSSSVDGQEMRKTFEFLDYVVHQLHNPTGAFIRAKMKEISDYLCNNPLERKVAEIKVIIFAFSGHGDSKGNDLRQKIYASDGELIDLMEEIVLPLTKHAGVFYVPKLLFIDASRGSEKLGSEHKPFKENYRIDYATIPHHVSYSSGNGSMWMPKLARALRERNDSLQNIADNVKREVHEHPGDNKQQCESIDRLNTGPLYLQKHLEDPTIQSGHTLADSPGLAILVTCDYWGTSNFTSIAGLRKDAEEMKKTFHYLHYVIHQLHNPTKADMQALLLEISDDLQKNPLEKKVAENKVIIFAFSGRGSSENSADKIYANDGEVLDLMDEIVFPLTKHAGVFYVPKLFFIDACRGAQQLMYQHVEGNYCIEYSTIPYHDTYAARDHGSVWMPKFAQALHEKDDSFQNIVAYVKGGVCKKIGEKQQCESVNRLITGPLYLQKQPEDSQIYSDPLAVMTDERVQEVIDKAMESGSLKQRDVVGVITGLMESGKTSLLHHLFGMELPKTYNSTGAVERSLRGFFHQTVRLTGGVWRCISFEDILKHLAPLVRAGMRKDDVRSLAKRIMYMYDTHSGPEGPVIVPEEVNTTPPEANATPQGAPQEESPGCKDLAPLVVNAQTATPLQEPVPEIELVHMIDTGGQPELMEVMPSIIHNANLGMVLLDLRYTLEEHPPVSFHEEGVPYPRDLPSCYTGKDIILKLVSTLHAKKSLKEVFRLIIVATHRDCVKDDLDARVSTLNTQLRKLLLPPFKNELIIFKDRGSIERSDIAFVLDLKTPDDHDQETLKLIRKRICQSGLGKDFNIPASFFVFEQDLLKFSKEDAKRDILSIDECKQVGARLKMSSEMVEAALVLYHRQNTFLYFRDVLPNHVFVKPQVPLDIINGIVRFTYKELEGIPANLAMLKGTGIVTEELLSYDKISPHFKEGFYEVKDAIKLFCHTLTLAPLEPEKEVDQKKKEYLIMCMKAAIPGEELHRYIPESSDSVPLIVKFSSGCVPLGCFGSTISCLLSKYGWTVQQEEYGTPTCLAHNVASLYDPELLLDVVLVDKTEHIEIHIEPDSDVSTLPGICSELRTTVFGAIEKVFMVMQLDVTISPAVVCSCPKVQEKHFPTFEKCHGKFLLRCRPRKKSVPDDKQLLWMTNAADNSTPTLPQLMRLQIPERVGVYYRKFGTLILNDGDGSQVDIIKEDCKHQTESTVTSILQKWIRQKPTSVTWDNLMQTLRETELNALAEDVRRTHREL